MKLFKRHDKKEDSEFARDAILSWGKKYDSHRPEKIVDTRLNMIATDFAWKENGFYFKIELPFSITKDYMDAITFKYKTGKCVPILVFNRRNSRGKMISYIMRGLFPLNSDSDPFNEQRNLKEFGPNMDKVDLI